jgi:gliding motility-associated-like protein
MNPFCTSEKHVSGQFVSLISFLFFLFFSGTASSQVTIGFQGGEVGDPWGYTSTGAAALAITEAAQAPNKVTGTTSLVVGGNTGGGNCWAGGSGNGPNTPRTFTFNSLDISSSNSSTRTLTFNWGNRFPSCNGTGWDAGENLTFTAFHNGVSQGSITLASGNNNAQFSILTNSYTWTIPPCVSQFYFVLSVTTNRADELLFLDDVKLTAPQLNGSLVVTPISGNTSVCAGSTDNYSITPEAGISYTWSGLPTGASFTTTNGATTSSTMTVDWGTASPGNYSLTVTPSDACGNTGTPETISVTVLSAPTPVTISGQTAICNGETITLTSSYSSGNTWSPNGETTQSISVTTAGTYTVSTTTSCGTVSDSHTVTLNASSIASITPSGPTSFCPGGSVTLTSDSPSGNSWSTTETTQSITVSTAGNYILTLTDLCGTSSVSQQVTILPLPNPQITGTTTFCAGQQTTLTATGGDTYLWSTGETSTSIVVTTAGNYTVTAFNSCGQATSAPTNVTINPLPNPQITGTTTFCAGQQTTLTATGGNTYLWSTGETSTSIVVTTAGNYTVTAFNSCGQATSAPTNVTINPLPNPQITGTTTFCAGQQTTLTATGGDTYLWSTGETSTSIVVTTAGNYTVTAFNSCGQTTSAPTNVTINPLPNPQITGTTTFCAGQQTTLTATGGDTYLWSTGETSTSIVVTTAGNYTVTAFNNCGQAVSAPVVVSQLPLPIAQITGLTTFCAGQQTKLTASGGNSYLWSTGETGASITVNTAGNYIVSASNSCGTTTASTTVIVSSTSASFTVNTATGPAPLAVDFTNTSDPNAVAFNWNFDDGSMETTTSPSHLFNQAGTYAVELTATNAAGCSATYSFNIEVIDIPSPSSLSIPNIFTPNGDHQNDQFIVTAERIEKYNLQILNRWGNVILTIENPEKGWDGTINGDQAAEGTYFYQITATGTDNKNYNETGFFELLR